MCGGEAVSIHGITPTGHEATITLTAAGFDFEGCTEDTALLQRIRKARCIYAGTREGTQRAVRIQCDCEGERPCKAYLHDHEQHGALPEESRPARGAWIEILCGVVAGVVDQVAPRKGRVD